MKRFLLALLFSVSFGLVATTAHAETRMYRCDITRRPIDSLNWVLVFATNFPAGSNGSAIGWCQNEVNHEAVDYCDGRDSGGFLLKYKVYRYGNPSDRSSYYIAIETVEWVCRDGWPYYANE